MTFTEEQRAVLVAHAKDLKSWRCGGVGDSEPGLEASVHARGAAIDAALAHIAKLETALRNSGIDSAYDDAAIEQQQARIAELEAALAEERAVVAALTDALCAALGTPDSEMMVAGVVADAVHAHIKQARAAQRAGGEDAG